MEFNGTLFFSALGLAFILESLPYILFPERMKEALSAVFEQGPAALRRMGLFALGLGLFVLMLTLA